MFIDEAKITVKGGNGGQGCVSFYRDKYMKHRRPDGGDGGRGGDVIFVADRGMNTLLDYKYKQNYSADKGGNASSNGKKGKEGKDCCLRVPVGTIVKDFDTDEVLKDLNKDKESVVVARGGRGGIGNANNKIPHPPLVGEQRTVKLELKVIADVGLIGFPNVGKSSIICGISKANSKIANYPFTTKQPILGIVSAEEFVDSRILKKAEKAAMQINSFIVADLPGLVEGAHKGKGLGDRFLKHVERTKLLVHVVDMASVDGRVPADDYKIITNELKQYSPSLLKKVKIVVVNKMDVAGASENLLKFKSEIKKTVIEISALEKTGLDKLVNKIRELLWRETL